MTPLPPGEIAEERQEAYAGAYRTPAAVSANVAETCGALQYEGHARGATKRALKVSAGIRDSISSTRRSVDRESITKVQIWISLTQPRTRSHSWPGWLGHPLQREQIAVRWGKAFSYAFWAKVAAKVGRPVKVKGQVAAAQVRA